MRLLDRLGKIWDRSSHPFLIHGGRELKLSDVAKQDAVDLSGIQKGDVVAIIGDFDPLSIATLLALIDMGAVIVPLTVETKHQHEYFFLEALVDVVIEDGCSRRRVHNQRHVFIDKLRELGHAGLVLFSTGTTGKPKAILHDLSVFLRRFETPRPTLRTINFLLFDHIGGINTLLHTLFNRGVVIAPESRTVDSILGACARYEVEVLPATPTFLRMLLMSGSVPSKVPPSLKLITYGTERMDQPTLDDLCEMLPGVDFRQTFGMSELGIVRAKSEARNSLYMKIGGEGVETRVIDGVLQIRSEFRMIGYLNADSPFDADGWYDTKDVVDVKGEYFKVVGRLSEVINVGGLKFMAGEVESVALDFPGVSLVKVTSRQNPVTGEHVEILVQPMVDGELNKEVLMAFLKERLPPHMVPKRIRVESVSVGHRFKRA